MAPKFEICLCCSAGFEAGKERAADRERDPRPLSQVQGALPLPAHPPRARGSTQNMRYLQSSIQSFNFKLSKITYT